MFLINTLWNQMSKSPVRKQQEKFHLHNKDDARQNMTVRHACLALYTTIDKRHIHDTSL